MKTCENCHTEYSPTPTINGKRRILYNRKFCYECSPFGKHNTTYVGNATSTSIIDKLSDIEFQTLVQNSKSRNEILFKLKMRNSGNAFKILNRRLENNKLDTSHFIRGGETTNKKISSEEVYVENSSYRHIRSRYFDDNISEYKCNVCGLLPFWNNQELNLQLDHINGDRYDNRKENLRWICPNCHTQTKTFSGKNFQRYSQQSKKFIC